MRLMWCSGRVAGAIMNYRPWRACVVALGQGRMVVVTPGCSTDWEMQVGAGERNVGRKRIASETGLGSAQCLCDEADGAVKGGRSRIQSRCCERRPCTADFSTDTCMQLHDSLRSCPGRMELARRA